MALGWRPSLAVASSTSWGFISLMPPSKTRNMTASAVSTRPVHSRLGSIVSVLHSHVERRGPGSTSRRARMKFMCLVYGEEAQMATVNDNECIANGAALQQAGHYVAAESLQPIATAT